MEKIIPKPKILNIEPPKYTVPDVTLMFDSDDSLIWKGGDNKASFNSINKINASPKVRCDEKDPNFQKENIKENKPIYGDEIKTQNKYHITPPVNNALKVSNANKGIYNPQLYVSPKLVKDTRTIINASPRIVHHDSEKCAKENYSQPIINTLENYHAIGEHTEVKSLDHPKELPRSSYIPSRQSYPRNMFQSKEKGEYLHPDYNSSSYKQANEHIVFSPNQIELPQNSLSASRPTYQTNERDRFQASNSSPYKQYNENIGVSHDAHILKLIEGQNQQILYLHKVLEKVLENSNKDQPKPSDENKDKHCKCNKEININDKKIAIVQTSFSDVKPETRTVSTNTDISWDDILLSVSHTNKVLALKPSSNSNKMPNQVTVEEGNKKKQTPSQSIPRDVSLTLKGIDFDTLYEPHSPDQSLHINVPEYNDDPNPINEGNLAQRYHRYNDECKNELEGSVHNSPLIGESAALYNERMKQDKMIMQHQRVEESKHEDNNGVTLYNNVMISIKQILQKTNGNENEVDNNYAYNKGNKEAMNCGAGVGGERASDRNPNPIEPLQMQQHFGISFLDPKALVEKPKVPTLFDKLYLQQGFSVSDLEIVEERRREKRTLARNITDAHLVAIAQRFPELAKGAEATHPSHRGGRHESDFSFATRQFLGKYEMDN